MPESEHRELPPEFVAKLAEQREEDAVELDLAALAEIKAKITASDPMLKAVRDDRA